MAKTSPSYHGKYKGVITGIHTVRSISKARDITQKEFTDQVVTLYEMIGEEAVKLARDAGSYHDITGNLRSSIGYIILVQGKVVVHGKSERRPGRKGDGAKGEAEGKALLEQLKTKFPWGIVLILCAGMEYAAFVENVLHKDVLTSATHLAESLHKQLLSNLGID